MKTAVTVECSFLNGPLQRPTEAQGHQGRGGRMSGRGRSQEGLLQTWLLEMTGPLHSGAGSSCSFLDGTLPIISQSMFLPGWRGRGT